MRYRFSLIIIASLFCTIKGISQQQYFFAGQTDGSVIYTDIEPDKKLSFNANAYFIDIDKNGVNDFKITNTFVDGAMMSESFFTTISGLNKNKIINTTKPIFEFNGSCDTFKIAKIFNFGDPIDKINDSCKVAQIYYSTISTHGICESKQWINIGSKYIGLILNRNDSLIYGWLKVNLPSSELTVMEYGVNTKGVTQISNHHLDHLIKIFPNPVKDFMQLFLPYVLDGNHYKLNFYNISGIKVMEKKINQTISKIDLSSLSNGTYLLEISNYKMVILKQKVVKQ